LKRNNIFTKKANEKNWKSNEKRLKKKNKKQREPTYNFKGELKENKGEKIHRQQTVQPPLTYVAAALSKTR